MRYDLAKKLSDAGFVQDGDGRFFRSGFHDISDRDGDYEYDVPARDLYDPTLSELIAACGQHVQLDWFPNTKSAFANCCDRNDHQQPGSTPEEAVARLWLVLNRKEV
ncbi:MAG: hypothetical protein JWO95_2890 [Verrucomicrobiales bacterium]|nr:hypothetical protein [Verrucomicrobiales bacterium]